MKVKKSGLLCVILWLTIGMVNPIMALDSTSIKNTIKQALSEGVSADSGLVLANEAYINSSQLGLLKFKSKALSIIGYYQWQKGERGKAIEAYLESIAIDEARESKKSMAYSTTCVGGIYYELQKFDLAEKYYLKAASLYSEFEDYTMVAQAESNLAAIYDSQNKREQTLETYFRCLEAFKKVGNDMYLGITHNNIAGTFHDLDKESYQDSAYAHYQHALAIFQKLDSKEELAVTYLGIAEVFDAMGRPTEAVDNFKWSHDIFTKIEALDWLVYANKIGVELYRKQGDFEKALEYYEEYKTLEDSLKDLDLQERVHELEVKYETEQNEAQIAKQDLELLKQRTELSQKNVIGIGLIVGILLVAVVAVVVYLRYRDKNASNKIITHQKLALEKHNIKMVDSINYAKNIQTAILPSSDYFKESLADSFILYQPKDIVSGDFYWVHNIEDTDLVAFSLADCTGHGVPGALMSMLGSSLLNEIVKNDGIYEPDKVLGELRRRLLMSIADSIDDEKIYDGMDIGFCILNKSTNELTFSGAYHSLYILTNKPDHYTDSLQFFSAISKHEDDENTQLFEVKGDTQPIGKYAIDSDLKYTSVKLKINTGDMLYMFSDGYVDQFGGPKNRKFMLQPFKKELLNIYKHPTQQQNMHLTELMSRWIEQGERPQMDDMAIIGVRV